MNLLAAFIDLSFYYKLKKVNNQNQTNNKSLPPILSGSISEKKPFLWGGGVEAEENVFEEPSLPET